MKKLYYLTIVLCLFINVVNAVEIPVDKVDFKAKNIDYNFKENLIIIAGDATFSSAGATLKADVIYYNTKDQFIYATGNIYFKDKEGNEFYPSSIIADQQFQSVQFDKIDGKLKDKSLISAESFERNIPNQYEIYDVCYTSCNSKGAFSPIWQVKSNEGFYDTEKDKVGLYNAWIELANIPIFWTPYASFSNFKKIREPGFLYPRYSINSTLGSILEIPFYVPIGQSQSIIIRNYLYSDLGQQRGDDQISDNGYLPRLEYNGYINNGEFDLDSSFYKEDWHLYLKANKEFNDILKSKISIEKTSNISYINLHEINPKDTEDPYFNSYLINELFFNSRHYLTINAYSYEDISPESNPYNYNDEALISYQYFGNTTDLGSINATTNINSFADVDTNIHTKLNLALNYNYKYLTSLGNYAININYINSVSIDNPNSSSPNPLNTNTLSINNDDPFFSYNSVGLSYEYPTNYFFKNALITISPIIHSTINTIINHNENSVILDSQKEYISANNLFENSQYNNFDYVNPNSSVAYGLQINGKVNDSYAHFFAGQKIETTDKFYETTLTLEDRTPSNYFFALSLTPLKHIYINYEAVYLPQFKQQKSSSTLALTTSLINITAGYSSNLDNPINEFSLNSQITLQNNLIFNIDALYNVSYTSPLKLKTLNTSLTWFNECLYLQGYINQSYYTNYIDNSYGIKILIKGVGDSDLKIL